MITEQQADHLRKLLAKAASVYNNSDFASTLKTIYTYIDSLVATERVPSVGDECPHDGCEGHLHYRYLESDGPFSHQVDNTILMCNKCWRRP